ncbi:Mitochondrial transcription termination factor family protein [Forsythia ovata]|uniref:Mitochondrial transcription termination factor family protein n=1 Tax=Forsythia ovata TaxID=205694 RepID=A0ABD1VG28_9LAMI
MLPTVFLCDPQKILSPKLDFLHSIGVLKTDIPKTIVSNPSFLGRSLEKQIIPCYNFLKSVPLSDKEILMMINRNARILGANVEMVASNVEVLRQYGVPPSSISFLISRHPSAVQRDNEKFKKCLDEVTRMGFNPLNTVFVLAVDVLCTTSKLTWDLKFDVFRRFGLSDDEILLAFRLHPSCMHLSQNKIARGMNFFVNEMKREPASVIRTPAVLFYSMEKRIIPRCRVIVRLVQKGFLKHNYQLMSFLKYTEEDFLSKFVHLYKDDLPELMDIYNQGMVCGDSICLDPTFGQEEALGNGDFSFCVVPPPSRDFVDDFSNKSKGIQWEDETCK